MKDQLQPKPIRVVYPGGLTDREHAIIEAHKWQLANRSDTPSWAYLVVRDLLRLLPYEEVSAAIQKGNQAARHHEEKP